MGWGVNGQGKSFSDDDGAEARPHGSEKTGGVDVIAAAEMGITAELRLSLDCQLCSVVAGRRRATAAEHGL